MDDNLRVNHNIIVEDRKKFTLTGIKDVLTFDEDNILLSTPLGKLIIKGNSLQILNFNNETGDLSGVGKIHAFAYTASEEKSGFFSRVFR